MAAKRKQYTSEFKHQAVRLVTEQGRSIAQDLDINNNLLSRWRRKVLRRFPGKVTPKKMS